MSNSVNTTDKSPAALINTGWSYENKSCGGFLKAQRLTENLAPRNIWIYSQESPITRWVNAILILYSQSEHHRVFVIRYINARTLSNTKRHLHNSYVPTAPSPMFAVRVISIFNYIVSGYLPRRLFYCDRFLTDLHRCISGAVCVTK